MNDEPYIWHADKHRSLPQADSIILLCKTRHAQSTQNDKLAYLQKSMAYEIDFLSADKY